MFDDQINARRVTLVAGLILLIVLAAVAAMSAGLEGVDHTFAVREPAERLVEVFGLMDNVGGMPGIVLTRAFSSERIRTAAPRRLVPSVHDQPMESLLRSLGPIREPMSQCFGDNALVAYDLGIAPAAALEVLAQLIETSAPEVHAWLRGVLGEFRTASGLAPEIDLVPHLGHGIAVGLLPAEADLDGWPLPRKVVIMRVLDDVAVARYLEAWIAWEAGAVAPMTHGVVGASIDTETVGGFDVVGLRLDGLLPAQLPLPSPSYVVADGFLIVSPVRSAVAETLNRLREGCSSPPAGYTGESVVEEVWLNFPEWPEAWLRAEPLIASVLAWLGAESPATIEACRSVVGFLGGFQPAHGTTSLTVDGGFVFQIELAPAQR